MVEFINSICAQACCYRSHKIPSNRLYARLRFRRQIKCCLDFRPFALKSQVDEASTRLSSVVWSRRNLSSGSVANYYHSPTPTQTQTVILETRRERAVSSKLVNSRPDQLDAEYQKWERERETAGERAALSFTDWGYESHFATLEFEPLASRATSTC